MTLLTIPDPVILDLRQRNFFFQFNIKKYALTLSYVEDGITGHLAVIAKFRKALFLTDNKTKREVENFAKRVGETNLPTVLIELRKYYTAAQEANRCCMNDEPFALGNLHTRLLKDTLLKAVKYTLLCNY